MFLRFITSQRDKFITSQKGWIASPYVGSALSIGDCKNHKTERRRFGDSSTTVSIADYPAMSFVFWQIQVQMTTQIQIPQATVEKKWVA